MHNVVRFEKTKRKMSWEQEEEMRSGKKRGMQRRQDRLTKGNRWEEQDDE
jgi:hypothetical protein